MAPDCQVDAAACAATDLPSGFKGPGSATTHPSLLSLCKVSLPLEPSDISTYNEANTSFHAVPSFMNLAQSNDPSSPHLKPEHNVRRSPSPVSLHEAALHMKVRNRLNNHQHQNGDAHTAEEAERRGIPHLDHAPNFDPIAGNASRQSRRRPHYDAEVLTKFMVYTGIGFLASTVVPLAFHAWEVSLS